MSDLHAQFLPAGNAWLCLAGYRLRRILSADLFLDLAEAGGPRGLRSVPELCRDRWADLAGAIAVLPEPVEFHLVIACQPGTGRALPLFDQGVVVVGRGRTRATAKRHCLRAAGDLHKILAAVLDYAEFEPLDDEASLARLTAPLGYQSVTELGRRHEMVQVGTGRGTGLAVDGFGAPTKARKAPDAPMIKLPHLFPWTPNDDAWWRLVDVMAREGGPSAVVLHARGWAAAPAACSEAAHRELDGIERAIAAANNGGPLGFSVHSRASTLRQEAQARVLAMAGPMIGARVFLAARRRPSAALLAVLESSVDDPSVNREQPGGEFTYRGGAVFTRRTAAAMRAPLDRPAAAQLFSPREATAVLRTPMPTNSEYPGFPLNRARTAPMLGSGGGGDCPLGLNVHRGLRRPAAMDADSRYRHCYVIGQTGTGKSTFLLHKIMHDIGRGRGVAVLDPHGTLIDEILLRYPRRRAQDLMIVDLTDTEYPVGFNPLYIQEDDPVAYRQRRDLVIDELYGYLERTYDLRVAGGPVFETHFRAMLGLLMGLETPTPPAVPNLAAFRLLYTNPAVRLRLTERVRGRDPVLEEFAREVSATTGEGSLSNVAPYITSKFHRFVSDATLRNITCQSRSIDFRDIVDNGRVLLINLGRGRIGDQAAGLLASQVVSRVQQATMAGHRGAAVRPFHLFADEFQLFASTRFAEMLSEGRKFGLSVTVAHQYAEQLPEAVLRAVLGNVGTTVLFRVGARDAEVFAPLFAPTFGARDLVSLPNFRAYVRGTGALGTGVFNVDVGAPGEDVDAEYAAAVRKRVRGRDGRPRKVVEEEIARGIEVMRRGAGDSP